VLDSFGLSCSGNGFDIGEFENGFVFHTSGPERVESREHTCSRWLGLRFISNNTPENNRGNAMFLLGISLETA
jgi:hypothetical protein